MLPPFEIFGGLLFFLLQQLENRALNILRRQVVGGKHVGPPCQSCRRRRAHRPCAWARGQCSPKNSATAPPRPPKTECSSTVTTAPVFWAKESSSFSSRGLMEGMSSTAALTPPAHSDCAASSARAVMRPVATMHTSAPSRRTYPLPKVKSAS